MKMNLILLAAVAMSVTIPVFATPEIVNMNLVRDPNTHLVTISYDLSEDAIVTAQVFTNGVALPHAASSLRIATTSSQSSSVRE